MTIRSPGESVKGICWIVCKTRSRTDAAFRSTFRCDKMRGATSSPVHRLRVPAGRNLPAPFLCMAEYASFNLAVGDSKSGSIRHSRIM